MVKVRKLGSKREAEAVESPRGPEPRLGGLAVWFLGVGGRYRKSHLDFFFGFKYGKKEGVYMTLWQR